MMRAHSALLRLALPVALPLALLLAGCTSEPSIQSCGLLAHAPARPIEEGWRYDVTELAGDPIPLDAVDYRFLNHTNAAAGAVFDGNVGSLKASGGNRSLKFVDAKNDSLFAVGDAFVVKDFSGLVLQLSRNGNIIGSSLACPS